MNAPDLELVTWRKSTRSSGDGHRTEVAELGETVAVRDSKDPSGPVLIFARSAWGNFVADLRR